MFLKKKTRNKGMNNKETISLDEVESRLFFGRKLTDGRRLKKTI